ncbi:hypothetical protein DCC39_09360 [Pueribacillus theae]|uniref:Uncharacterized protein n=1 Tax=Pueribacillus theae TaxID=2171751 RepID=A0A2U1K3T1_9BACI|nr:hypothetical protein [Pueribacillus theae]PWA11834.1 hypothetical protein DCC39_09360 [Pueribacillus theae]
MSFFILFIFFALFSLFIFNSMTNSLCQNRNIPEERQPKVFRFINVSITILLISSYVEVLFT